MTLTEVKKCGNFTCGNAVPGEPYDPEKHCGVCWQALHNRAVTAMLNRPLYEVKRGGKPVKRQPLPCVYRSEEPLTAGQAAVMRLDSRRSWHECGHPERPNPHSEVRQGRAYACPCKGCNAGCTGYAESVDEEAEAEREETNRDYQRQADEFLRNVPAFPVGRFEGRGITIAAGGRYWASCYVTVRMLRHVGCTLPIQVWYLDGEQDERYQSQLNYFGVGFVNIDTHPARESRRGVKGFQTKLFAALNSPFEEVLSIDPDSYPCSDPTVLFEDHRYKRTGGIYWPDGAHTNGWTQWRAAGVKEFGPKCGFETGQYVIHKRIAWDVLQFAEWYDDHPEWTYGGAGGKGGLDYGDKIVRVAWAKMRRQPTVFNTECKWEKFAFIQPGPDGKTPMFIHRCRNKFTIDDDRKYPTTPQVGPPNARANLPGEEDALRFLSELNEVLK